MQAVPDGARALRYISGDGRPLFRFEVEERSEDDACFQIIDRIETEGLEPGNYAYHIRWLGQSESVPFEVAASSSEPVR